MVPPANPRAATLRSSTRCLKEWVIDARTLNAVLALLRSPAAEVLPRLSAALVDSVPHAWAAALIGGSVQVTDGDLGDATPTAAELERLAERVLPGESWYGDAVLGGISRLVLAMASTEPAAAGSVLVLVDAVHSADGRERAQRLWDFAVVRLRMLVSLGPVEPPLHLAVGRIASGEQAKALAAQADAHAATLTAVLGALRSRRMDDATARQVAVTVASSALTELRAAAVAGERSAGEAFAAVGGRLRALARHCGFDLELAPPDHADRLLAPEVSAAAHAVVRGCVLAMVEHSGPRRIRVGWAIDRTNLRISVRDDGDGALFPRALAEYRLRERLAALGGDFSVEAVSGWGTTVSAWLPLALPPTPEPDALGVLSDRELDVLTEIARGRRNREIAAHLHITEHTVKFHVVKILSKLGVRSRGEAAALARRARL